MTTRIEVPSVGGGGGGGSSLNIVSVTTTPISVTSGDTYLVNTTTAKTLNLPAPASNTFFEVRDVSGSASTNNITIQRFGAELIDGVASNKILATNKGYWIFVCDGTNWTTLLNYPVNYNQLNNASGEVLVIPAGLVGAPSLTTVGDTDTGIYFSGSNEISLTAGGLLQISFANRRWTTGISSTTYIDLSVAGIFQFQGLGSEIGRFDATSAPEFLMNKTGSGSSFASYAFVGDPDTGMYSSGNNALDFTTAGTNRIRIDSSGRVSVGVSSTLHSTLQVDGSFAPNTNLVSSSITLDSTYFVVRVDASGAARTITLPAAAGCTKRIYIIKKIDSSGNAVTVDGNGAETIDGAASVSMGTQYQSYIVQSNGTSWDIINPPSAGGGGGGASWTEVEVDFGTKPAWDKTFTITDGTVTGASKIIVSPSGNSGTSRVGNDLEWDNLIMGAVPGAGQFTLTALAVPGPVVGNRKVFYTVA